MQRYFIDENYQTIQFNDEQLKHILKVMRMTVGDQIEVVFKGRCFKEEITSLNPFEIKEVEEIKNSPELNVDITLLYCLPKGDKLDLVIQKATEIGVKEIILVQSSRCVTKYKKDDFNKKLARFNKIALEASEQSHRFVVPVIKDIINFSDIKQYHFDYAFLAYENERNNFFTESLKKAPKGSKIGILIGSEGGFDQEEVDYAFKNNYQTVSLGKRILRSETACIYALSVISFLCEDK